jgi:hypothetical protein
VGAFHGTKNRSPSFAKVRWMRASACWKSTASSMTSGANTRLASPSIIAAPISLDA